MTYFVFKEELKYQLKSPLIYFSGIILGVLAFFHFSNSSTSWNGLIQMGSVYRNSEFLITNMLLSFSLLGILLIFLPVGSSISKDFKNDVYHFIFTTGLKKSSYLTGRLLAAFVAVVLVFILGLLGIYMGSFFSAGHLLGVYKIQAYALPFLVYLIPNLVFLTALFFTIGTLKQDVFWLYGSALILLIAVIVFQGFSSALIRDPEQHRLMINVLAFLDFSGYSVFKDITSNWNLSQKSMQAIPLTNIMIFNRLIWLLVSFILLWTTYRRFRMEMPQDNF